MCGIGGIWGLPDVEAVKAMIAAMDHRGPDDSGYYHDSTVALGMTRLSILDLTSDGHQPMFGKDGMTCIIYNGEVYNFQSERGLLERNGCEFSSTSDTEVVLRMYEHYGDDFVLRLHGMFALAIYDRRRGPGRERLFLARDPLGIKPLLYARVGSRLIFASELKALLASGLIERALDPVALRVLLTHGSVAQPRTMIQGVRMLMPAHRMILDHTGTRIERYWSLAADRERGLRARPYDELIAELSGLLRQAVRVHMVSDVPVGAFLSGGIDSSLITALMIEATGRRVKTFSVGFGGEETVHDESFEAGRTAEFLGADHTTVSISGRDVLEHVNRIAFSLDQPSADGVNSYFVSRGARQAVKVALSGIGADEIFGGYQWFRQVAAERRRSFQTPFQTVAKSILAGIARRRVFDGLSLKNRGKYLWSLRNGSGFLSLYNKFITYSFGPVLAGRLLHSDLRRAAQAGCSPEYDHRSFDELSGGSVIERVTGLTLRGYMSNQLLRDLDAVSMSHSLEVRVPYLDRAVIEMALSLPDPVKLRPDQTIRAGQSYRETGAKRILIDAGRPLLPKDFDLRPKRGFLLPQDSWLRGPLREHLYDTLSEGQVKKRGVLDPQEVSAVKEAFLERRQPKGLGWAGPWLLMMLELWCREILDRPVQALVRF